MSDNSRPTTAVIVAAGRGRRLAASDINIPKGLIRLGEKTIIEESLNRLESCGITRVVIVTGFKGHLYDAFAKHHPGMVQTVHSPCYEHSGNLNSLIQAATLVDCDFLLLDSDLIYELRALHVLLQHDHANAVLVTTPSDAGDEEYIQARQLNLEAMSKNKDELTGDVIGEWVGISRISRPLWVNIQDYARERFKSTLFVDYKQALVHAARNMEIHCELIDDLIWSEIDDEYQLKRASERIYPEIVNRQ